MIKCRTNPLCLELTQTVNLNACIWTEYLYLSLQRASVYFKYGIYNSVLFCCVSRKTQTWQDENKRERRLEKKCPAFLRGRSTKFIVKLFVGGLLI